MKRVTGTTIAGIDFRIVVDDELSPDKFALVNDTGRGIACDLSTGDLTDHIGTPLEPLRILPASPDRRLID
jgi:hypothetical protein